MEKTAIDRELLRKAQEKGRFATFLAYVRLSGPGWLQSAITLGGGSLAGSLYLGVLAGTALMWVQPLAMLLGIVMLSAIAYVTLSTGERPFRAINVHVNPVLGWAWLLAALSANMFWCLPQYALATDVLQENLLPTVVAPGGTIQQAFATVFGEESWVTVNAGKLVIALCILVLTTAITWFYDSGRWGIKLYEFVLKLMVAGIVICFFGVVWAIRSEVDWGALFYGFVPDLSKLFEPSDAFLGVLEGSEHAKYWTAEIVNLQRERMIGAAATAVGINMTFLFPYSLLAKNWTREFRGLTIFDLGTGMLIPFVLATSCVVVAAANQFHTRPVPGFLGEEENGELVQPPAKHRNAYYGNLLPLLREEIGSEEYDRIAAGEEPLQRMLAALSPQDRTALEEDDLEALAVKLGGAELRRRADQLSRADREIAAMLINRDAADLAQSLAPFTDSRAAPLIFGLGVLGMTLSTITILMLISGFCVCEMLNVPSRGWPHRIGALAAATGALGPFIWGGARFYLAIYVSVFGMMLLPIAYWSFFFLMNQKNLLGDDLPRGGKRVTWNILMIIAGGVATAAALWSINDKTGKWGLYALVCFLVLAGLVQMIRWIRPQRSQGG